MNRKRLLITSTDLMMIQFLMPHVRYLSENGFAVELACSEIGGRLAEVREAAAGYAEAVHQVSLVRSPFSPGNVRGYRQMVRLLRQRRYDIIWTNEPVMGVVTRLAARQARRQGTKVVYMCHGFHFYQGAGPVNWLLYYPIERLMSRFCDVIVTINREDEARARTFHCPRVEYIHGIGVDTERLRVPDGHRSIRDELGLKQSDFLLLSVGELNKNKNQQVILRAMAKLGDRQIHCCLCGHGDQREKLEQLARELGIEGQVHFLGYRRDVAAICTQADVFVHSSRREGLSVASLEAMYFGLPLILSNVRGSGDYLENGVSGFLREANDVEGFAEAINLLKTNAPLRMACGQHNRKAVERYCINVVKYEIETLLSDLTD